MSIVPLFKKLDNNERLSPEERKLFRDRSLKLSERDISALREAFTENPDWQKVWLFFDGHVENEADYVASVSQAAAVTGEGRFRTAALVSIATKGIPIPVCRLHPALGLDRRTCEFTPGFPYYIYTSGMSGLRYFEIEMDTGETLTAYVDPSRQYAAEGLEWRDAKTRRSIPNHRVNGFFCIDGKPAFPEKK